MMLASVGLLAAIAFLALAVLLFRSSFCPPPPAPPGAQVKSTVSGLPGTPQFWTAYNYNGDMAAGPPTSHLIYIGSDAGDLDVGGATASTGESYMLVVTGLTSGSASAALKLDESDPGTSVSVTDVSCSGSTTDTFSVYLRPSSPTSSTLLLYMILSGKGVQIEVT